LEEAIRAFHDERVIQASEYLKRVKAIMSSVITRTGDDLPNVLRQNDVAKAFYGCIQDIFENRSLDELEKEIWAQAAIEIENIIRKLKKVDWEADIDKQNQMRNAIDDFLFDFKKSKGFDISSDQIDQIMEKCIDIAKVRIH
jgi:type I restriction enzyme R subunit